MSDVGLGGTARITALYAGADASTPYDEQVTELEHALQAAALAEASGASPALVAAALLHDVGHLLLRDFQPIGEALEHDARHELAGASHLRRVFGREVAEPVRLHVAAKRYLVATDPGYGERLSPSSVRSLAVQGGAMGPEEIAAFEAEPGSPGAVALRRWDDEAKVPGLSVPDFDHYRGLLERIEAEDRERG